MYFYGTYRDMDAVYDAMPHEFMECEIAKIKKSPKGNLWVYLKAS